MHTIFCILEQEIISTVSNHYCRNTCSSISHAHHQTGAVNDASLVSYITMHMMTPADFYAKRHYISACIYITFKMGFQYFAS